MLIAALLFTDFTMRHLRFILLTIAYAALRATPRHAPPMSSDDDAFAIFHCRAMKAAP